MQSGYGPRDGDEFSPSAAFPVGAAAYDCRIGAGRTVLFLIFDVVTNRRLITAPTPSRALVVDWPSAVHHVGESLDLIEESFASEVMSEEHLVIPMIVTGYVSHLLVELARME
jgi:hypothetical protein